jgi:DNA (cytosine-5)-methyltransferase 1
MAGLMVRWGIDNWEAACETWKQNFPQGVMLDIPVDEVVKRAQKAKLGLLVDILHLSPPCQFWSPAHTIEGKYDEENQAALYACGNLLDISKPRIATLEQTFGLADARFHRFFHMLIRDFTDRGYSIRWKIVAFASWVRSLISSH